MDPDPGPVLIFKQMKYVIFFPFPWFYALTYETFRDSEVINF